MAVQVIPAGSSQEVVLTFVYDPTGLAWVECSDHRVVGWLGDDGVGPGQVTPAMPIIVAGLPAQPPATGAVLSPRWAQIFRDGAGVQVPGVWRGRVQDFWTWLATNNGALRQIKPDFLHEDLEQAWRVWSAANPALVYGG